MRGLGLMGLSKFRYIHRGRRGNGELMSYTAYTFAARRISCRHVKDVNNSLPNGSAS